MDISIHISIAAVAMAFMALVVSIWNAAITKRHNRLSVRPHLSLANLHRPIGTVKIILSNTGIGPAIFRSFEVHMDGAGTVVTSMDAMGEAIKKLELNGTFEYYFPAEGDALPSGESIELLSIEAASASRSELQQIRAGLGRLSFHVKYESMYREKFLFRRSGTGFD